MRIKATIEEKESLCRVYGIEPPYNLNLLSHEQTINYCVLALKTKENQLKQKRLNLIEKYEKRYGPN